MGERAHTPGPWAVVDRYPREGTIKVGCSGGLIAYVGNGFNIGTVGRDAELIAAAPEMFAALQAARQFIANGVELGFIRMPDASTPDPAHDTLPAIEAALAKASPATAAKTGGA